MSNPVPPVARAIDHVILGVADLKSAESAFAGPLGFQVSGGGVHPRFGTANRLIVLESGYIELITGQPGATPSGFIGAMLRQHREGWVGYALETADPAGAATLLRERGFAVDGPDVGQLATTNWYDRGWQTVRLRDGAAQGLPFLIRHDQSGPEHRRLLAGVEGPSPQPNGARSIASMTIAVRDLAEAADRYHRLFDLAGAGGAEDNSMLQARVLPLLLPSGTAVKLAAPRSPGVGPVAEGLAATGEGLFSLALTVEDLPGVVRALR
ncbi:MAG: VOC family protein, partial [Chloroflexota bacterium]